MSTRPSSRLLVRAGVTAAAATALLVSTAAPASAEPEHGWVTAEVRYGGMPVFTEIGNGLNTTIWRTRQWEHLTIRCESYWWNDFLLVHDPVRGDGWIKRDWLTQWSLGKVQGCYIWDGP
jgi:hypothetical protein